MLFVLSRFRSFGFKFGFVFFSWIKTSSPWMCILNPTLAQVEIMFMHRFLYVLFFLGPFVSRKIWDMGVWVKMSQHLLWRSRMVQLHHWFPIRILPLKLEKLTKTLCTWFPFVRRKIWDMGECVCVLSTDIVSPSLLCF